VENQGNLLPSNIALHICILIEGPTAVAHAQTLNQSYGAVAGISTQMGSSPTAWLPKTTLLQSQEFEVIPGYHRTHVRSTFKLSGSAMT
jgi:hypothetical protein